MSARAERRGQSCGSRTPAGQRRGVALLVVIVIASVVGIGVLALWRGAAAGRRVATLEGGMAGSGAVADSALVVGLAAVDAGAWRRLAAPGDDLVAGVGVAGRGRWRATIGRVGWSTLVVRGVSEWRSGVPDVPGRADRREVVPLVSPLSVPVSALTAPGPWVNAVGATVVVPAAGPAERACRAGASPSLDAVGSYPDSAMAGLALVPVDPDTVSGPLAGAFRLVRGAIRRPLRIEGMVVIDTDLVVGADLRLAGMLVVRGSVLAAGGRLDMLGAIQSGDAYGGHSGLGPTDLVRYDACAIRHAVERVTWPAGGPARTPFRLF